MVMGMPTGWCPLIRNTKLSVRCTNSDVKCDTTSIENMSTRTVRNIQNQNWLDSLHTSNARTKE
jgi:hypothetical protein